MVHSKQYRGRRPAFVDRLTSPYDRWSAFAQDTNNTGFGNSGGTSSSAREEQKKQDYETLGVSPNASSQELLTAYRAHAKKHHPGVGGDETRFTEIQNAFDRLKTSDGFTRG